MKAVSPASVSQEYCCLRIQTWHRKIQSLPRPDTAVHIAEGGPGASRAPTLGSAPVPPEAIINLQQPELHSHCSAGSIAAQSMSNAHTQTDTISQPGRCLGGLSLTWLTNKRMAPRRPRGCFCLFQAPKLNNTSATRGVLLSWAIHSGKVTESRYPCLMRN